MADDFFSESEKASLRQVTLEELAELAGQLQPLLAETNSPPPDNAARSELQLIFHTIGGSAGLAGLKEISSLGVEMESLLRKPAPGPPLPAETMEKLRAALRALTEFLKTENCA